MRSLALSILVLLCLVTPALGQEKPKGFAVSANAEDKPIPAVRPILEKAVREVRMNRQAFDKANEKPLGTARESLQELAKKLIEDGKTEEAKAVLSQVDSLDASVMSQANAPSALKARVPPHKPMLERLAGKWDVINDIRYFHVYPSGDIEARRDDDNRLLDKGRIVMLSPEVAEVRWPNGWRNHLRMAGDDVVAVSDYGPDNKRMAGLALERIK